MRFSIHGFFMNLRPWIALFEFLQKKFLDIFEFKGFNNIGNKFPAAPDKYNGEIFSAGNMDIVRK